MIRAIGRAPSSRAGYPLISPPARRTICFFRLFRGASDRTNSKMREQRASRAMPGGPMKITRRGVMQGATVTTLTSLLGGRAAAEAAGPIRVGLLTVKTGPLASGGIDMERALVMYLKERNNELAGRKIDLFVAATAGGR